MDEVREDYTQHSLPNTPYICIPILVITLFQVLKTLIALKKGGVAFIIISHRDSYVKELGFDRSLVLRQMRQSFPEVQT